MQILIHTLIKFLEISKMVLCLGNELQVMLGLDNEVKVTIGLDKLKIKLNQLKGDQVSKRNLHANGGLFVLKEIHVIFLIKNQIVVYSHFALKEIPVNSITSKRIVSLDQHAIKYFVLLIMYDHQLKRG